MPRDSSRHVALSISKEGEDMDNYIMPVKVARAFKTIIKKEHTQPANLRVAEFIRLGCTAYDYTLSYTDTFVLIHCRWPHKQDFGNVHEGWRAYFTKTVFINTFCLIGVKSASYPMTESELPFRNDIMGQDIINHLFDMVEDRAEKHPRQKKFVNAKYLYTVLSVFKALADDGRMQLNIGTWVTGPISLEAYNPDMELEVRSIVMPIVR